MGTVTSIFQNDPRSLTPVQKCIFDLIIAETPASYRPEVSKELLHYIRLMGKEVELTGVEVRQLTTHLYEATGRDIPALLRKNEERFCALTFYGRTSAERAFSLERVWSMTSNGALYLAIRNALGALAIAWQIHNCHGQMVTTLDGLAPHLSP